MKVYCLFEQSGTFKNEFKKLGYDAFDIDIENRFKQTDIIEDLFSSIRNENGIFDMITKDDLVLSFFPCIRFSTRVLLNARGLNAGMKNWDNNKKLDYSIKTVNEINIFYSLWCKMFQISLTKGFKMIVENPFTKPNVLSSVFPINPTIVDMDRREMGDYVKKPTCYWFVNCEPKNNYINDIIVKKE